jgi:hypothetical protein
VPREIRAGPPECCCPISRGSCSDEAWRGLSRDFNPLSPGATPPSACRGCPRPPRDSCVPEWRRRSSDRLVKTAQPQCLLQTGAANLVPSSASYDNVLAPSRPSISWTVSQVRHSILHKFQASQGQELISSGQEQAISPNGWISRLASMSVQKRNTISVVPTPWKMHVLSRIYLHRQLLLE